MTRQRVALPSFREEGPIKPYDMRQLVAALEYRLQSLEDVGSVIPSTTVDGDLDNLYAPLNHTHVVADITDFDANVPSSIFDLDDVDGSPAIGETLIWDGNDFVPGTSGGSHTLGSHSDVYIPTPNDGDALTYVNSTGRWESLPQAGDGANTLLDLDDTDIATQNQYDLLFNADGENWHTTATDLQWNPVDDYLQLALGHSINWRNASEVSVELLVLEDAGLQADPDIGSVVMLLTGETAVDGATSITSDIGNHTFTSTGAGTAEVSTNQAYFGTRSLRTHYPSGVNFGIWTQTGTSADFDFAGGDFTIEFDFYSEVQSGTQYPLVRGGITGGSNLSWYVTVGVGANIDRIDFAYSTNGTGYTLAGTATPGFTVGAWYRVAICRNGADLRYYVEGTQVGTTKNVGTSVFFGGSGSLEMINNSGISIWYMDNVRITKGVARYTGASYTLDTGPYDGSSGFFSGFVVGDPVYPTQIDGLTAKITSASTDIDGTLNVDGAAVLQDTLKIKGITEADSFVRLGADITTATPPTTETPTSQLQFWDIDYTDQIGAVGYFAGNIFGLRNEMWNGPAQFEYRDSAGTLKDYLQAYPNANTNIKAVGQVDLYVNDGALGLTAKNGGVDIYVNNNLKAEFGTQGLDIHSATNADNAVNIVRFSWLNGTDRGFVGYSATDDLYVLNQVTNGSVIITPNGTGVVNVTGAVDLDSTLNVDGISTLNNDLAITTTLDDATGDEVALSLDYTTNKATSGADTGFQMTMTDTLSPGASLFADYRLGAVTLFDWGIDGTYRIYDATGADSAAFSHDGTDFNTSFVNTTDWNLNNITNVDIHDGGALRLFHTDNTSSYTMSRNAATVTFESSVTSDNLEFLGHQQIRFNKNTAGNTQFFIGEDSTIYGSNSTAYLELWGEQSSTKYALRMQVNSDTAVFASIGAGAIDQVLFGTAIWANNNIEVHDGSSLVIYNSTDNDSADFSHDGIDFNTVFTNTTDWNVTGLAGFNVANYSFDVDQTVGAGQDNFVLTYDDVSGLISLEAAGGGGIGGSITDNQVAVGATTADDIEGSANLTWDGTDLDVTGGITVSGDAIFSQLASGSTATMVLTNNQPRLDIIDDNAAANTGIWSFANVAGNFRLTPFSDAYSAGNNAIQITRSGNNANIGSLQANARWEVVNNTDFWVRDGAELVILDSSDADSATFSHDGTDFNTAFTNTTDWNITSLTSIQAGTVDADFDVVTATNVSTDGYLQLRTATDTELNAIANAINTDAGKIQGAVVYNTTTDNPVYATGNTDGAVWVDGAGTTVNTPV